MDFLKAEISRKRKAIDDAISQTESAGTIGSFRFIKQKDLKALREKEKEDAQRALDSAREQKQVLFQAAAETSSRGKFEQSASAQPSEPTIDLSHLTVLEVKNRLRNHREPVTLFGETDDDRLQRLVKKIHELQNEEDDFRIDRKGSEEQQRQKSIQDEKDDDDFDGEVVATKSKKKGIKGSNAKGDEEVDSEDDDDDGVTGEGGTATTKSKSSELIIFSRIPDLPREKLVHKYFRSLLKQWEWDLNARDDREKYTAKGKMETRAQKQCKDSIRPLFKLCKRKEVPYDILEHIAIMVQFCEEGDFVKANDRYLKCAIGNAAWPIGLTMVGIHERSGREKISTSKVAHIMNNEQQRKYLSSVKRLITFAQTKRPDVPPSKKVF